MLHLRVYDFLGRLPIRQMNRVRDMASVENWLRRSLFASDVRRRGD
jgi:hypothetical protein